MKIIRHITKFIVLSVFFLSFFFIGVKSTDAAIADCACKTWSCSFYRQPYSPWGTYSTCTCTEQVPCTASCGPGSYVCNRVGNCCPYSVVTPPITPGGGGGGGGGGCTETAPTNLTSTRVSPTSATLSWTPGTPGGSGPYQALWVSTNPNPQTGCAGSNGGTATCPVRRDTSTSPIPTDQTGYTITNLLTANKVYYWEVANIQSASCYKAVTTSLMSSCSVSPSVITINQGSTQVISSTLTNGTGIQKVNFTSNQPTNVSVNPATDTTFQYQTTISGLNPTTTPATVTSDFYTTTGTLACSASTKVTILPIDPWWQVENGDVSTNGDLTSSIPPGSFFEKTVASQNPGIPAYGGTTNLSATNVSAVGWLAASPITNLKVYDYQYLTNQIPADTVIVPLTTNILDQATLDANITPSYGYYWYKYDGSGSGLDLNLNSNLNIGTKKVILLVNSADFNINGNINLTDGKGFFMVLVGKGSAATKGNIVVDPAIGGGVAPNLEGIYEADGIFESGTTGTKTDSTLWIRGSVAAYSGFSLKRDLGSTTNATTKAELFTFAPDQIMLYPTARLGIRRLNWKEVAP